MGTQAVRQLNQTVQAAFNLATPRKMAWLNVLGDIDISDGKREFSWLGLLAEKWLRFY